MAEIRLDHVAHSYHPDPRERDDWAVKALDFAFENGRAYALLGPSGCGKTTMLNIISGLLQPTRGRVLYDGVDVTALPPARRNIAQVFQFPVVYDTMTVAENLAFPLRNRGLGRSVVERRVGEVAHMLELDGILGRRAAELTADQKQKISLGRGLVREDVAAILFDEPLTVVDPQLKWRLRRKLKEVHARYAHTLVYVTHDQNEALTFADIVIVMHDGEILQIGTPQELFERPRHRFVGYFIGSPGMNLLPCHLEDGALVLEGTELRLSFDGGEWRAAPAGGCLELGIRPEFVEIGPADGEGLPARLEEVEELGSFRLLRLALGPHRVVAKLPERREIPASGLRIRFPREWLCLYGADGALIA